jgi:thiamine biosynthesis lipoprotein
MNRHVYAILTLVSVCALWGLGSCTKSGSGQLYRVNRLLMGTLVQITVVGTSEKAKAACQAVIDEIERVENLTSFHKPSALTRLNEHAGMGPTKTNAELLELLQRSLGMARQTHGAFDPTIGTLSRLWNFSGGGPRLPSRAEITQALAKIGWKKVTIDAEAGTVTLPDRGMAFDLGAIAKGYALDRAAAVLKQHGISAALVNAGGDILALGMKGPNQPWRVGVQAPREMNSIVAVAELNNRVIVTSGDYERFFEKDGTRYHHILSPRTGYPARGVQSVTIVSADGVTADSLATAVFVSGVQRGLREVESMAGVEGLLIDSAGKLHLSSGAGSIFNLQR